MNTTVELKVGDRVRFNQYCYYIHLRNTNGIFKFIFTIHDKSYYNIEIGLRSYYALPFEFDRLPAKGEQLLFSFTD